jgi:hypothetical protein
MVAHLLTLRAPLARQILAAAAAAVETILLLRLAARVDLV